MKQLIKYIILLSLLGGSAYAMQSIKCGFNPRFPVTTAPEPAPYFELVNGNNQFTFDVFNIIKNKEKNSNFIVSPFSIGSCLLSVLAGAKDLTQSAMQSGMHLEGKNSLASLSKYRALLTALLSSNSEKTTFAVANGLWVNEGYHLEDSYVKAIRHTLFVEPTKVDFKNAPQSALQAINQQVSNDTRQEIPHLLQEISPDTRVLLTNALFFQAPWHSPFPEDTFEAEFTLLDGSLVTTNYMTQTHFYPYGSDAEKQWLLMAYDEGKFATLFVLPAPGEFENVMANLDHTSFQNMMTHLEPGEVHVRLPQFGIRSRPSMKDMLLELGLGVLFDREKCDLSGINGVTSGDEKLFIGDVVHEAVVEMTPSGTKAAAATAIFTVGSTSVRRDSYLSFNATRPFMFFIVNTETNTILFAGSFVRP